MRGGLAGWQQRIVSTYIDEHLAEQVPLARLTQLVGLSPYYFCRAFKQSFGLPPRRYHSSRRMEEAKILLAKPELSVTEVGLAVGFSGTSPFTPAFHKATGLTPSAYHRSLRLRRYSPRRARERRKSNTAMGALLLILIACATLGLSIASAHKQSLANARTVDRSGRAARGRHCGGVR